MSRDGISSVADLTILIDANTEKFANGLSATREMVDQLATQQLEALAQRIQQPRSPGSHRGAHGTTPLTDCVGPARACAPGARPRRP